MDDFGADFKFAGERGGIGKFAACSDWWMRSIRSSGGRE